jgi:hypothetical protein
MGASKACQHFPHPALASVIGRLCRRRAISYAEGIWLARRKTPLQDVDFLQSAPALLLRSSSNRCAFSACSARSFCASTSFLAASSSRSCRSFSSRASRSLSSRLAEMNFCSWSDRALRIDPQRSEPDLSRIAFRERAQQCHKEKLFLSADARRAWSLFTNSN